MPSHHQVTFVRKDYNQPPVRQITHVGGTLANGTPWTIPVTDAISGISSGRFVFTVCGEGDTKEEKIVVARSAVHGAFLRAESDNSEPKRLMMLPEANPLEEDYY